MMKKVSTALDEALKAAGVPIVGVSVGRENERSTWRVDIAAGATPEQVQAAEAVLDAFDPSVLAVERVTTELKAAVQRHLDTAAQALGYESIFTACTYADEPAVPKFQAEGQAFRAWRSQVWGRCLQLLGEVQAKRRALPTEAELLALLPALVLPE